MAPRHSRILSTQVIIDVAAVLVMQASALAGFWPVFGGTGFIRPAVIGMTLGLGIAWLGAWRRWPTISVAAATVFAYFLFGGVAALWKRAIGGIIPDLGCLKLLAVGSISVWKQFVTASTPLGSFTGVTLVPYILALVTAVCVGSVIWRSGKPGLVILPIGVLAALVILLGTSHPFLPTVQAIVLTAVAVAWLTWRTTFVRMSFSESSTSVMRRSLALRAGVQLLIGALVAGLVGSLTMLGLDRETIRRHMVPPLDTQMYTSPLVSFRDLVDTRSDKTLFVVEGWEKDLLLRLAVMDTYDGMVYNVGSASGASRYDRVGPDLGDPSDRDKQGDGIRVTITVDEYAGVWVPSVSLMERLSFTGEREDSLTEGLYYNPSSDTLINTAGLGSGVRYVINATPIDSEPTFETPLKRVSTPRPQWVPEKVSALSSQWAGTDKSPLMRVESIITTLRTSGYYSHGLGGGAPSSPGHSSYRIARLLERPEHMIGDDEQYAVAAALLLLDAGIPARVVMGFHVDADSTFADSVWEVKGSDAHAWVEVPFDGIGWVPFFPTPDKDQEPKEIDQRSHTTPKPQVLQPPPPANSSDEEPAQSVLDPRDDEEKNDPDESIDWMRIAQITAAILIPLLVVIAPWMIVLAWKARRRRRRMTVEDQSQRVANGWQELMDRSADLGMVTSKSATRKQIGMVLTRLKGVEGVEKLALLADKGTFAPTAPTPQEASQFWDEMDKVSASLSDTFPKTRRFTSRFSWTSLRSNPKSTDIQEWI